MVSKLARLLVNSLTALLVIGWVAFCAYWLVGTEGLFCAVVVIALIPAKVRKEILRSGRVFFLIERA